VHDVILDLRERSDSYGEWQSFRLSAADPRLLYVPEGFAQGLQTLEDDTEIVYQVSTPYSPEHGRGMRFDDPAFDFDWPLPVSVISDKDRGWPDFVPARPMGSGA
jgi:dTDP-4-dehydrorhamnose 3,5-epimerase